MIQLNDEKDLRARDVWERLAVRVQIIREENDNILERAMNVMRDLDRIMGEIERTREEMRQDFMNNLPDERTATALATTVSNRHEFLGRGG